jgi:hypothetical protein
LRWKGCLGSEWEHRPSPGIFKTIEGTARREGLLFKACHPPPPRLPVSLGKHRMLAGHRCSCDLFPLDVFPVNRNRRALSVLVSQTRFPQPHFEVWSFVVKANLCFYFLCTHPHRPAHQILALEINQNEMLAPCGPASDRLTPLESFYDL